MENNKGLIISGIILVIYCLFFKYRPSNTTNIQNVSKSWENHSGFQRN